jgi:hypothetical protein
MATKFNCHLDILDFFSSKQGGYGELVLVPYDNQNLVLRISKLIENYFTKWKSF